MIGRLRGVARKKIDLTGKRFGRLVVVRETDERCGSSVIWQCACDCGHASKVPSTSLITGNTKSCGCLQKEQVTNLNKSDISGQIYGRLTAIHPTERRDASGSIVWKCECSCGNMSHVSVGALKNGSTQSCGCLSLEVKRELGKESILKVHDFNKKNELVEGTLLNSLNKKVGKNSKSGIKGVHWNNKRRVWVAVIIFKRKSIFLGHYSNVDDAIKARKEAEEKYFHPILEKYGRELTDD